MTFIHWLGWLVAAGLGVSWWIDRRGLKGAISDAKDAANQVRERIK